MRRIAGRTATGCSSWAAHAAVTKRQECVVCERPVSTKRRGVFSGLMTNFYGLIPALWNGRACQTKRWSLLYVFGAGLPSGLEASGARATTARSGHNPSCLSELRERVRWIVAEQRAALARGFKAVIFLVRSFIQKRMNAKAQKPAFLESVPASPRVEYKSQPSSWRPSPARFTKRS